MHTPRTQPRAPRFVTRWLLTPVLLVVAAMLAPGLHAQSAIRDSTITIASTMPLDPHGLGRAALVGSDGVQYGSVGGFGSDLDALGSYSRRPLPSAFVSSSGERVLGSALLAVDTAVAATALYEYMRSNHFDASDPVTAAYLGGVRRRRSAWFA